MCANRKAITLAEIAMALVVVAIVVASVTAIFYNGYSKLREVEFAKEWDKAFTEAVNLSSNNHYQTGSIYTYTKNGNRIFYAIQEHIIIVGASYGEVNFCTAIENREKPKSFIRKMEAIGATEYSSTIKCSENTFSRDNGAGYFYLEYKR